MVRRCRALRRTFAVSRARRRDWIRLGLPLAAMAALPPLRCDDVALAQPAHLAGDARAPGGDLLALLARIPGWAAPVAAVPAADVTLTQLGGAMSNHIFRLQVRFRNRTARAAAQKHALTHMCAALLPRAHALEHRRCCCASTARRAPARLLHALSSAARLRLQSLFV